MKKFTFFLLLLAIPLLTFGQGVSYDSEETTTTYVRKNANSPGGQADLEAMKIAFEKMRDLDCSNGVSWYYQGAIHNIPSEVNGNNLNCDSYNDPWPQKWAWGDCTHVNSDASELNFLLWHRMYTWHLESIVRKYSGKSDFALPYWNYGSPSGSPDNILAAQVTDPESSLYTHARNLSLNAGEPIVRSTLRNITNGIADLQSIDEFGGDLGFSSQLEQNPHNVMHGYMGSTVGTDDGFFNEITQTDKTPGLMALVISAGFDPGFWLHHSMVDRIWYNWDKKNNGAYRPTLQELEANPWTYDFIQPDGSQKSYTMKEIHDIVFNLDYTYDNTGDETIVAMANVKKGKPSKKSKKMKQKDTKEVVVWDQKIRRTIGKKGFTHKLSNNFAKMTKKVFLAKEPSKKILRLNVIVYDEPTDYYSVFIRYPNDEEVYVGVMTFFGVAHEHGEVDGAGHSIREEGVYLNYAYHVSDKLVDTDQTFDVIFKKHGDGKINVTLESMTLSKIVESSIGLNK